MGWFRWRLTFALPLLWLTTAWFNFQYPGDEYGGFAVGSLPGLWLLWLVPMLHQGVSPASILPWVLAPGVFTMGVLGHLCDRLRAPLWPFLAWPFFTVISVWLSLRRFPSYERAMMKNGSLEAYILPSMNFNLFALVALLLVLTGLYRGVVSARRRFTASPLSQTGSNVV